MALASIWQNKLRSVLTMLGIIIGVGSVVTVLALGAGIKKAVTDQVASFGTNVIQVNPGQAFTTDEQGNKSGFNFAASLGTSTLDEKDVTTLRSTPGVTAVAANMIISGIPSFKNAKAPSAFILATSPDVIAVMNRHVASGQFFKANQTNVAVLGAQVAEKLFGQANPIGKSLSLRNRNFLIAGVMEAEKAGGLSLGPSLDDVVYIPFTTGKAISGGVANILEIDVKAGNAQDVNTVAASIKARLKANHGGQEDFTVLTAEDQLKIFDTILNLMTSFVAAIAAISLLVGGIGVMNIMFVSVTERTREIGVRKAIGASSRNVLGQFMVEAIAISLVGGALGVGFSLLLSLLIDKLAHITPVFTFSAFITAVVISTLVGVIFGTAPAIKAARKNPIEALRYE